MGERHIACSLTSTLLRRVHVRGGADAVSAVLAMAGGGRTVEELHDVTNWIFYDEAIALFDAAAAVTGDEGIARAAGEESVRQHSGTPVATLLRSLGSPEAILEQVTTAATKFSVATEMEALVVEPGRAQVVARARPGFERHRNLCAWTQGLLSQPTALFGLPPAQVEESECQAAGAQRCLYEIRWDAEEAAASSDSEHHITALEGQLTAMAERVESVLATAADLISHDDVDTALARITLRAATAVRAPRYLLAVRPPAGDDVRLHHKGLAADEAGELAERVLADGEARPQSWLVAEIQSARRHYGRLVAIHAEGARFFGQERELFDVYARYAAIVLDRATALADAQWGHEQASSMLELARALAAAGGSDEVAQRLADAVPAVVDCDRVTILTWDDHAGELCFAATCGANGAQLERLRDLRVSPSDTPYLDQVLVDPAPRLVDRTERDPYVRGMLDLLGDAAVLTVPILAALCSTSTSTTSRASTTATATGPETSCCASSPSASARRCVQWTPSRAWVATSSPCWPSASPP